MNKKVAFALVLVLVVASAAALLYRNRSFEVVHPRIGDITEAVYGLGRVKSNQRYDVIIAVMETVKNLHADEGHLAKRGEKLLDLESGASFRAPFDGTVTLVKVRPGETALPQMPILRLENLKDRYIELSLEQEAALRVQKGQHAKVSFESLRGQTLTGEVTALFPREDEFLAHVRVEGLAPNVLPGMTADVTIEVGKISQATLIPLKALSNGMISIKRGGRWKKIKVDAGHIDGAFAEIKAPDLNLNDEIRVKKEE